MRQHLIGALVGAVIALAGCGGRTPAVDPAVTLEDGGATEFDAARAVSGQYVLGTSDVFDVSFLFERTLNTRVVVRPDGYVALPIVGEIRAAGRTPAQVDSILTEAYARYYREPDLTVNVVEFAPPEVYVLGEVRNPRSVPLTPGMSALQAIAVAGGAVPGANLGSVVLLRREGSEKAVARRIDLSSFLKGHGSAYDLLLAPSDIVYVPATFVARLDRFVQSFFGGLTPIPILYLRGWEAFHTKDVYDTYLDRVLQNPSSSGSNP